MPHYPLSQFLGLVKSTLQELFGSQTFRCIADVYQVNIRAKIIYLELVEYDDQGHIIAKAKGIIRNPTIWFRFLQGIRRQSTDMKDVRILFSTTPQIHPLYGFSLTIQDISVEYTRGQQQLTKENVKQYLSDKGILHHNKTFARPELPLRIAIISSEGGQGYQDFCAVLDESGWEYTAQLLPAMIHGDRARSSILQQIERATQSVNSFDILLIVRGGGESSGLSRGEDKYIAEAICTCPFPVILAVGHTSDTSLLDEIVRHSSKTPTDAGYVVVQRYQNTFQHLQEIYKNITDRGRSISEEYRVRLDHVYQAINQRSSQQLTKCASHLEYMMSHISTYAPDHLHTKGYATLHDQHQDFLSREQIEQLSKDQDYLLTVYAKTYKIRVQ